MWFRRDLRVHDLPALAGAARADRIVPVFVFDDRLLKTGRFPSANRTAFMLGCLRELDAALRDRGAQLVVRHGKPEREIPDAGRARSAPTTCTSPPTPRRGRAGATRTVIDRAGRRRRARPRLARRLRRGRPVATCAPARASPTPCSPRSTARGRASAGATAATTPRKLSMPSNLKTGRLPVAGRPGRGATSPTWPSSPARRPRARPCPRFLREPVDALRGAARQRRRAAPRGCRPTCAGAACRRWSWRRRRPRRAARARPRSCASWPGATSTPRC